MWRLLAEATYGKCRTDYNDGPAGGDILPLDPVTVAGTANCAGLLKRMQRLRLGAIADGMAITHGPLGPFANKILLALEKARERSRRVPTRNEYAEHFNTLVESNILQKAHRKVLFYSSYFAVPKDETVSRAIFNGRRLSSFCPTPPNANLASTSQLMTRMTQHLRREKKFYVLQGDLRHWFHQLKIREEFLPYFGLRLGNCDYIWKCLPMGWSFSPYVAQCYGWSFLSYREESEKPLLDESCFGEGKQLPTFVDIPGGFVTIYYDNFLVVSRDEIVVKQMEARLHRTSRQMGVHIKEGSLLFDTPRSMEETGMNFLGIHFQTHQGEMCWRPAKLTVWQEKYPPTFRPRTTREYAEWMGRALFGILLGGKPLGSSPSGRSLRKILMSLGRTVYQGASWDGEPPSELQRFLTEAHGVWTQVMALGGNPYRSNERSELRPSDYVMVSDASDTIGAWLLYVGGHVIRHEAFAVAKEDHIFIKELYAACAGIESSLSRIPEGLSITVCVDNSAVAWALENGFSGNTRACQMLEKLDGHLNRIHVVRLVSADNPADCPTRKKYDDFKQREDNMFTTIAMDKKGRRWSSKRPDEWQHEEGEQGMRHAAPPDPWLEEETEATIPEAPQLKRTRVQ